MREEVTGRQRYWPGCGSTFVAHAVWSVRLLRYIERICTVDISCVRNGFSLSGRPKQLFDGHLTGGNLLNRRIVVMVVLLALSAFVLSPVASANRTYTIATVFKLYGDDWFHAMDEGVQRFAKDTGHRVIMTGPPLVDSALQVQIIEDLIAQRVDAITVAPIAIEPLEPVLKKAMDAGIVVITYEGAGQVNTHYDLEPFDNKEYGAHLMDLLAELMAEKGEYVNYVSSLNASNHMAWVDGAVARQGDAYPNMTKVRERVISDSSQAVGYHTAKELLITYPNLVGFQSSAAPTIAGIGLAVEEMGLEDETFVVGTSLPSVAGQYLQTGAVDVITFWDPRAQGYSMNALALKVLRGEPIRNGMDLSIPYPGYDNLKLEGNILYAQGWIDVTKENAHEYPF